jgi:hypothetical protein
MLCVVFTFKFLKGEIGTVVNQTLCGEPRVEDFSGCFPQPIVVNFNLALVAESNEEVLRRNNLCFFNLVNSLTLLILFIVAMILIVGLMDWNGNVV